MSDFTEIMKLLIPALEKEFGPIEYYTSCTSFEDSPEFKRIANIGVTTPCSSHGCLKLSVNCCCFCEKAICMQHSHDTISESGYDAYACVSCVSEM